MKIRDRVPPGQVQISGNREIYRSGGGESSYLGSGPSGKTTHWFKTACLRDTRIKIGHVRTMLRLALRAHAGFRLLEGEEMTLGVTPRGFQLKAAHQPAPFSIVILS